MAIVGAEEKTRISGCELRRLAVAVGASAAGFYATSENSIRRGLARRQGPWFGEGGGLYSVSGHSALHEIGKALHYANPSAGSRKGAKEMMDLFQDAVKSESKGRCKGAKRAGKGGGKAPAFPPAGIVPTDYAGMSWAEFFADTYSL